MDPEIITKTDVIITEGETRRKPNPLFPFMGIGSLIYAFFYTLFYTEIIRDLPTLFS